MRFYGQPSYSRDHNPELETKCQMKRQSPEENASMRSEPELESELASPRPNIASSLSPKCVAARDHQMASRMQGLVQEPPV